MSSILHEIEAQIAGLKTSVAKQNVGTVREISDGVARLEGLTDAMLNEMLDFGHGVIGLALNLEEPEVGAIKRQPVSQPVETGIMAIDAMIPIGRGQRELIIGDRSTGKTTIGIDTMINQARINKAAETANDKDYRPLYSIYVAVGQKQSNIARVIAELEKAGAMPYTIILAAAASDSATNQYIAPFAGAAM